MFKNVASLPTPERNLAFVGGSCQRKGDRPTPRKTVENGSRAYSQPGRPLRDVQRFSVVRERVGLPLRVRRLAEGVSNRPAELQSHGDGARRQAGRCCPIGKTARNAVMSQQSVAPLVTILFCRRGPANVSGFIVPVVVGEAVKRVSGGRARPHVGEEVLERRSPPFANFDAAASVAFIAVRGRAGTPAKHLRPDRVERVLLVSGVPVLVGFHRDDFSVQTTATGRAPRTEAAGIYDSFLPARAAAAVVGNPTLGMGVTEDGPPSQRLPREVTEGRPMVGIHPVMIANTTRGGHYNF